MKEPIVQTGDPVLRKKAQPIAQKDIGGKKLSGLIARMKKLLAKEGNGVGLAAPQVGESLRLFIVAGKAFMPEKEHPEDADTQPVPPDMVFINPELVRLSRAQKEMSEGCLSVRGTYGTVMRAEKATVRALGENGKPLTYHGSGLIAHIFQHEIDHLEGILYTDKAISLEDDERPHRHTTQ